MNKLLTIALPTYNRAKLLDQQLAWLAKAIKGFESECEIIISDNCSEDNTQEIVKKWQMALPETAFHSNRNSQNLGVMRNIAYCLNAATSQYVWTISDDDKIEDTTISYLINTLKTSVNLGLLILNFSCRHEVTGELLYERCYQIEDEIVETDGRAVFERCIQESRSGVQLMSAQVYRTDLAQRALKTWSDGVNNLDYQVYLTGFCAFHGNVRISKDVYLENAFGASHWMVKPKMLLKMQYTYSPEVNIKLKEIGYSDSFCRNLVINHFNNNNWRVLLGALRRWPVLALTTVIPYFGLVSLSVLETIILTKEGVSQEVISRSNSNNRRDLMKSDSKTK
ncbi:Glycosyl transferase, family 2 [Trichormus variabilis ATCC 29413]|uniref:Glycosyl transferase, family 2 n=2 Tax=Anabaena variabilis TaxID=264691 RepID=Q3ME51_TRIV2|nr:MULTISPECIES: glycosyltransferase family 2 protein [Nostocaceae]ABA20735.1 Glycosyl transferase, family 2 [Trichormus variabilis ATCC 29413]MBC1215762.1 glycosyltransferase family 2 protein [Trichormus variabilis ARAD]MBC1254838.1 glycosyltransferase family 2 protein [Trichormus variabilis V5]MBC1267716.1 glycosyltransferase family 2 protein [Trichormus variabilis FSR]MBC1304347.1 glycosyltransferase family 2 protein [Trichormus variabilis N2B]